jgi:hypothetical protein
VYQGFGQGSRIYLMSFFQGTSSSQSPPQCQLPAQRSPHIHTLGPSNSTAVAATLRPRVHVQQIHLFIHSLSHLLLQQLSPEGNQASHLLISQELL